MKAFIFILGVLFITNSNAQKFDCPTKMTEYQALFKAKKIAESYDTWTAVSKNCPKENEAKSLTADEISKAKMNGKLVTIGCWINETLLSLQNNDVSY